MEAALEHRLAKPRRYFRVFCNTGNDVYITTTASCSS